MTNSTTEKGGVKPAATTDKNEAQFDRAEFNRTFALLKSEVNGIVCQGPVGTAQWRS